MFSAENPVADVEIDEPTDAVDQPGHSEYRHVAVAVLVVVKEVEVDEEKVEGGGTDEEGRGGGVHIESVPGHDSAYLVQCWHCNSTYFRVDLRLTLNI